MTVSVRACACRNARVSSSLRRSVLRSRSMYSEPSVWLLCAVQILVQTGRKSNTRNSIYGHFGIIKQLLKSVRPLLSYSHDGRFTSIPYFLGCRCTALMKDGFARGKGFWFPISQRILAALNTRTGKIGEFDCYTEYDFPIGKYA